MLKFKKVLSIFFATLVLLFTQNCGPGYLAKDFFSSATLGSSGNSGESNLIEKSLAVKRLSNIEYLNSIETLLRRQIALRGGDPEAAVAIINHFGDVFKQLPRDRPQVKMGTDQVASGISSMRFTAYMDIANALANNHTQNIDRLKQFVGGCVTSVNIGTSAAEQTCARGFINEFATLAFRQPPTAVEVTELLQGAVNWRTLMARILIHPRFLLHFEREGTVIANTNTYKLNAYELSARLASVFWKSLPDEIGMQAAANGSILTAAGYQAEVSRILNSPKAEVALWEFYKQWLAVSRIPTDFRSGDVFETFAGTLNWQNLKVSNVLQDGRDFLKHHTWQRNGTLQDVFRSTAIFTKDPIVASIYGVSARVDDSAPPVMDPSGKYVGILTRPLVTMQAPSLNSEINHILRGTFLLANIIGMEMEPPASFDEQETQGIVIPKTASTRMQVALKTSLSQCIGCHSQINPAGFALGNFDSFGRYLSRELRYTKINGVITTYADNPINATTTLRLGATTYNIDGVSGLVDALFASGKVYDGFTKHYLQFAFGRVSLTSDDDAIATSMRINLKTKSIKEALEAFAMHPAFARAQAPGN